MYSFSDRLKALKTFTTLNDQGLEAITNLTSGDGSTDLSELFVLVKEMTSPIRIITYGQSLNYFDEQEEYEGFVETLEDRIEEIESDSVAFSPTLLAKSSTTLSPTVKAQIAKKTTARIRDLNPKLEGSFDPEEIKLDDIVTPHDAIRYMHQIAVDAIFDPSGDKWNQSAFGKSYNPSGDFGIQICSLDEQKAEAHFEKNPFFQRFKEIADGGRFSTKKGSEHYMTLASGNSFSMQMNLGCHYATIKVKRTQDGHQLSFQYQDTTSYATSKFRADMSEMLLSSFGYEVDREENKMRVEGTFDTKDAVDKFEQILRFTVSLKDVDCLGNYSVEGREQDLVDAFNAGVINLFNYISTKKEGTFVEYAINAGTCLLPEEEQAEYKKKLKIAANESSMKSESQVSDSSEEVTIDDIVIPEEDIEEVEPIPLTGIEKYTFAARKAFNAGLDAIQTFWEETTPNYNKFIKSPKACDEEGCTSCGGYVDVRSRLFKRGIRWGLFGTALYTIGSIAVAMDQYGEIEHQPLESPASIAVSAYESEPAVDLSATLPTKMYAGKPVVLLLDPNFETEVAE